jgi:hypothetical protein
MALLISAFALNAAALWLLFGKRIDVRSLWSTAQTEPVAPAQRTVPVDSLPGPSAGGALLSPTPIAAVTPGALAEAAMPMPSISIANEVTVTPQAGLALLASQQYGAWNATVRDLIVTANPSLGNPDTLPPETKVRLPALTRDTMVVQDRDGKFSVYYATFDSEDLARHDLEAMKPTWTSAQVAKVERQGATVFRLYLGAFASRAEADTAAKTLSFKYLPALT